MYGMQKSTSLDMKDMPRVPSYPSFSACPSIGSYVFSPQYTYVVYPQHHTPTTTHASTKLRYRSMSYDDTCIRRGSSTVAIDNKIEQAMDLVKSHLMFAVREEVEVLKEQIKDLLEKIGQLEHENRVLKDNASQETLSKLTMPKSQPPSSSS